MKIPFLNKNKVEEEQITFTAPENKYLQEIKPKEKYQFFSDYFRIDSVYAAILNYFHTQGASENYGYFWGISKIPNAMHNATTINFDQVERMSDGWIREHQSKAEQFAERNVNEQANSGSLTNMGKASQTANDMQEIAHDLLAGASYLHIQSRLMIKAPTLSALEDAQADVGRKYQDYFSTLRVAPYIGEQRQELLNLLSDNDKKKAKSGFYMTSSEYAGSYMLVTHGLEDMGGEYVGTMYGDVNTSAVLFDVNYYRNYVVVATSQYEMDRETQKRNLVSDMWGSKIGQACLIENGRVVHFILNDCNLDRISPKYEKLTRKIDMNNGDLNMFEVFGEIRDEKALYAAQLEKLVLMTEQLLDGNDTAYATIIKNELRKILNQFYIDAGMWVENAAENEQDIRVVGIPHADVPRLKKFVPYLHTTVKAAQGQGDHEKQHALNVLEGVFSNLLETYPDLFNQETSATIDDALSGARTIYDFSRLSMRGKSVAMAQFINVIGFAMQNLGDGDTVIIHGAQNISPLIRDYVTEQLSVLYRKGGRAALLYDDVDAMLSDQDFNRFDNADYTILGDMRENTVRRYEQALGTQIAPDLKKLIQGKSQSMSYIRRGFDNVVFNRSLQLMPQNTEKKRRFKRKKGRMQ